MSIFKQLAILFCLYIMSSQGKLLFWFRDNLSVGGNNFLQNCLADCDELIPVFCFDPREIAFAESFGNKEEIVIQLINKVLLLRKNLQERGSNLLVVNDNYEKMIPSLARVLNVEKVATEPLMHDANLASDEIIRFRNLKTQEVKNLLSMHSIPMIVPVKASEPSNERDFFPCFPSINVGQIPTVNQFLENPSGKFRSIAC